MKNNHVIIKLGNIFELLAIIVVLALALAFQFVMKELPCPLCLLQRAGFICIAFGFLLNLRYGFRPSHYAIVILSALYTSFVALRQIVLHVIPGTGEYGSPFLGLHLYTWVFVISMVISVVTVLLMSIDRQYDKIANDHFAFWKQITNLLFALMTLIITANIVSTVLECGFHAECPDDPVRYEMLY